MDKQSSQINYHNAKIAPTGNLPTTPLVIGSAIAASVLESLPALVVVLGVEPTLLSHIVGDAFEEDSTQ
jgi:hypothetical protein